MTEEVTSIVIDNGSQNIRAGFSGDDEPRVIFSSVVGDVRFHNVMDCLGLKNSFVGNEAQEKRDILALKFPIKNGIVKDWDGVGKLWHHTFFDKLKVSPTEHPILLTEPLMNPTTNREKMAQIMFEQFNVPKLHVALQPILSIFAAGLVTGIVVESGHGVTQILPIFEGCVQRNAIQRLNFGGSNLTDYLAKILTERGYYFESTADLEVVREIKERICYVAHDFDREMTTAATSSSLEKSFELADGTNIVFGNQCFRCAETLFQPHFLDFESPSFPQMTYESIMKCGIGLRKQLYSNVIVSGGNTLFPGFIARFQNEMSSLAPPTIKIDLKVLSKRENAVWTGGSILASLPTFQTEWSTKQEYDEFGPSVLERKFLDVFKP
uniref:Uncharacterized protein n=1 Tax=Panagrolaimus sp. JU765 TaxID=591449 RepID=A0AC34QBP3_9BILA